MVQEQSLMLPLGQIDDGLGRNQILDINHKKEILAYFDEMGSKFKCSNYQRFHFGFPIDKFLDQGYRISIRGLRETTPHACAQETARYANQLLTNKGFCYDNEPPTLLELCTGLGQSAYSYSNTGFKVVTVERHELTYKSAIHNIQLAGLDSQIEFILDDALEFLNEAVKQGSHYSVVHTDPPWGGHYDYDLDKAFSLANIAIDAPGLIEQALKVADVAVLNLPHNLDVNEIQNLANSLSCHAVIEYQFIGELPACFGQAPVFFFQGHEKAHQSTKNIQHETVYLTIDGQRIQD